MQFITVSLLRIRNFTAGASLTSSVADLQRRIKEVTPTV